MKIKIPIFRRFKHDELKKVRIPDGNATDAVLSEIVSNTRELKRLGLHTPDVRSTHDGDPQTDDALGWVEAAELSEGTIHGTIDLTPLGEAKKQGKLLRWVSSSIRRDFSEGDRVIVPGLYLDHVAFLGRTRPRIKGLADISTAAGFSEKTDEDAVLVDQTNDAFSLFSEVRDEREDEEADMADEYQDAV